MDLTLVWALFFMLAFLVFWALTIKTSPGTTGIKSEDERRITMTKEQLVAMGLTDEQADKVLAAFIEEMKGFIPKHRLDEVIEAKKQLEKDIAARDIQLEELKKIDAEGLKDEISKLQEANKVTKEEYDAKLRQMQIDNAVEKALLTAKAKNIKAVKALLDLENAELDGEAVKGLDEQIKKLAKADDSKFLFGEGSSFTGINPADGREGNKEDKTKNPWKKETFNLTEQGRILRENPELAAQLKASAN